MHYTIERTSKKAPFGDILESNRRAGNEPGKAQAYALARQLGKDHPDCTIFVNEVISRDEENIIAVVNANDDVKAKYPDIEYLDIKRFQKLLKAFKESLEGEIARGSTEREARESIYKLLTEVRPQA